jgi:hypothetical protein
VTVSTPCDVSVAASDVPKKALAYCFTIRSSSGPGARPLQYSPRRDPLSKTLRALILR